MIGWVFFRSSNLADAVSFCGVMFGFGNTGFIDNITPQAINEYGMIIVAGILGCVPFSKKYQRMFFGEQ